MTIPVSQTSTAHCKDCEPLLLEALVYSPMHTTVQKLRQGKLHACPVCSVVIDGLLVMVENGIADNSMVTIRPGSFGRPMEVLYEDPQRSQFTVLQYYVYAGMYETGLLRPIASSGAAIRPFILHLCRGVQQLALRLRSKSLRLTNRRS